MTRMTRMALRALLFVAVLGSASNAWAARLGALYTEWALFPGQKIVAPGCYYGLVMQDDGNLVTYGNMNSSGNWGGAYWATGTNGRGGWAIMQSDYNFVVYNWADQPVWATNTSGSWGNHIAQQDDANVVLYTEYGDPRWEAGLRGQPIRSVACNQYSRSEFTEIRHDFDCPGGDYRWFEIGQAHPSWCGYFCAKDRQAGQPCTSYAYVPPGYYGPNARCYLKSSTPNGCGARTGIIMGIIYKD